MNAAWLAFERWWCRTMHTRISRPMHGQYHCWECGQVFACNWDQPVTISPATAEDVAVNVSGKEELAMQ